MTSLGYPVKKSSGKTYRWLKLRTFAEAGMPGVEAPQITECRSMDDEVHDVPRKVRVVTVG